MSNPHLYRAMYLSSHRRGRRGGRLETFATPSPRLCGAVSTQTVLSRATPRVATQFWTVGHGAITLQMAQLPRPRRPRPARTLLNLFAAYGDDLCAARGSPDARSDVPRASSSKPPGPEKRREEAPGMHACA
jgi:hypothetical protein